MAKLSATNLNISDVHNAVGDASYGVGGLCSLGTLNPWSFYGPNNPVKNGTTNEIESQDDVAPFNLGDFRYYDHAASIGYGHHSSVDEVHLYEGTHDGPTDTIQFEIQPEFFELNFKKLDSSINSIIVQPYSTSGFGSPVGSPIVHTIIESTMSPSPPPNHQDQLYTKIIQGSSNNWPMITITNPWSYTAIYPHIYLSDAAINGNMGQPPVSQPQFNFTKHYLPKLQVGTIDWNGQYGAYTKGIGFTSKTIAYLGTSVVFTAHAFVQSGPGGGSGCPDNFQYILGEWEVSYTYASVERVIHTGIVANAEPTGAINCNGSLYNAGDGTDKFDYDETRIMNFKLLSTSEDFGNCFTTAPNSII